MYERAIVFYEKRTAIREQNTAQYEQMKAIKN
jgi:hypothetical protein